MQSEIEKVCDQHADLFDCPDHLIQYVAKFREYGLIIHDGGSSKRSILFCPWCGKRLPESLRSRWFEELERLGIDPGEDEVPGEFSTSAWWSSNCP